MKPLSFHCPHCNQHIETEPAWAGRDLDCPNCKQSFIVPKPGSKRMSAVSTALEVFALLVIVAATAGILWAKWQIRVEGLAEIAAFDKNMREINPEKFEDAWQTHRRLEAEAEADQLKACSNWVGFNRIIDHYILASAPEVSNWTGSATIDFLNKNGGIERTNLPFRFDLIMHHAGGWVDTTRLMREEYERHNAALSQ